MSPKHTVPIGNVMTKTRDTTESVADKTSSLLNWAQTVSPRSQERVVIPGYLT